MREIAHRAGVSIGSVSTVLNNRQAERRISPLTAEKIRAMAAKLGYLPNIGARLLRSGDQSKNTIVLALVTSFEAPITLVKYFIVALQRATAAGSDYSFSLLVEMFSAGHLREMPGLLTGDHFNAALIMNTTAADDAFLTRVHLPYPSVLVNRAIPGYASIVEAATAGGGRRKFFSQQATSVGGVARQSFDADYARAGGCVYAACGATNGECARGDCGS